MACKTKWYWTMLNLIWASDTNQGICFGHLWYISCDYWFFICGLLVLMVAFKYSKNTGLILACVLSICSIIVAQTLNALNNGEWTFILLTKKHPNLTHPYNDRPHMDTYIHPWCRLSPYLIGLMTGYFLAEEKARQKTDVEYRMMFIEKMNKKGFKNTWKRTISLLALVLCLCGIIYFPLPQYTEVFYPYWIGVTYPILFRPIWSIFLAALIYITEKYRTGWIYNIFSCDYFILPAKLNFSTYVIHYILLPWITQGWALKQYYFNWLFGLLLVVGYIFICYFFGLVFYVLVEYPLGVGSRVVMDLVAGKGKKSGQNKSASDSK